MISIFPLILNGILHAATPEEIAHRQEANKTQAIEKPFAELSHQQVSEYGTKALKMREKQWKHAESNHFIIHYQLADVKDRLVKEAEFYYWKIQYDLKLTEDLVDHKSHIFIFQNDDHWRQFQANTDILEIAGVTIGHEFYSYYPRQKEKEFSGTLAHEMTHLVFNRFFTGHPPLWLNEGFAEYQSHNAYWSFYDRRFAEIEKDVDAVGKIDFLNMTQWETYPQWNLKSAFYVKSHLAIELLIQKGGVERFVPFVNTMIQNHDFEAAFKQHYHDVFQDTEQFIKALAVKEKKALNQQRL